MMQFLKRVGILRSLVIDRPMDLVPTGSVRDEDGQRRAAYKAGKRRTFIIVNGLKIRIPETISNWVIQQIIHGLHPCAPS